MADEPPRELPRLNDSSFTNQVILLAIFILTANIYLVQTGMPGAQSRRFAGFFLTLLFLAWGVGLVLIEYKPEWIVALAERGYLHVDGEQR